MSRDNSRELVLLGQADRMLAEARTFEDIKAIRDKAEAARTYARAAQMGLELQNRAAELKLKAERQAGRFLAKLALRGGDRRSKSRAASLKLADLGITRDQSRRWQLQAAVPEKEFRRFLTSVQAAGKEVTAAGLLRLARTVQQREPMSEKSADGPGPILRPFGQSTAESTTLELLVELENHRQLLAQLLRPVYENRDIAFTSGERRIVGRLLTEMQDCLDQLKNTPQLSKSG